MNGQQDKWGREGGGAETGRVVALFRLAARCWVSGWASKRWGGSPARLSARRHCPERLHRVIPFSAMGYLLGLASSMIPSGSSSAATPGVAIRGAACGFAGANSVAAQRMIVV